MNRRAFLLGMGSILAAPAIVRASSLMPVRALPLDGLLIEESRTNHVPYMDFDFVNGRMRLIGQGWAKMEPTVGRLVNGGRLTPQGLLVGEGESANLIFPSRWGEMRRLSNVELKELTSP